MFTVNNLCKSYGELKILDNISFTVTAGESLSISGPSGAGKSTLLNILGQLEPANSGTVTLGAVDVLSCNERDLPKFRRENIGFIFQEHHLLPQMTALENVLMPFLSAGRIRAEHRQRGIDLLTQVGLAERLRHRPAELSGGERQRVAIARALIFQPLLLLADEPTGNLDRHNAAQIGDLLLSVSKDKILIVVTHDPLLAKKTTHNYLL